MQSYADEFCPTPDRAAPDQAGRATTGRPSALARRGPLRHARVAALAVGGFLLPWCVLLSAVLPASTRAQHWSLAWAGLDGAEAVAALATAVLLARASTWASLTAVAGGT